MMINAFDFMLKSLFFVRYLCLIEKGEVKFKIYKVTVKGRQTVTIRILPKIPRNTMKFHTTRQ